MQAKRLTWPILVLWGAFVLSGFAALAVRESSPGAGAQPPKAEAARGKCRLLVFIHPECPCSRSTLAELDRLLSAAPTRPITEVYVYAPHTESRGWAMGSLYKQAVAIRFTEVRLDPDGDIAKRYKVQTSGQTVLYSPKGVLLFSGGITASRAHEGDNDGRDAILAFLAGTGSNVTSTPVYGCSFGFTNNGR
ncbi:hypothetical protein [Fimbriimonas ginsengisoli]|uniref:RedB protein n=1 Tax=Fimbriimonas ginsengisoli Gsoil 348 TaxID=661478 RepID=A0A068NYN3_FIMGI|nr:hypothetical protein [Fimbriimonas ginsengisoli]AIE87124.1 hypothetical protein OP10G_3756 [Fimbriimonas ginsengisoli Gsoil 348]